MADEQHGPGDADEVRGFEPGPGVPGDDDAPAEGRRERRGFRAPDASIIIFSIIVLAALATWVIPPGAYQKHEIEVQGVGTREVVVPGTFEYVPRDETALWPRVRHTVGMIFLAPILGLTDEDAAPIIAFVLLIGGAFAILSATGAVEAALKSLVAKSRRSVAVERGLLPLFMVLFAVGGGLFGMAEETIPFILIFVPLALALGYDSLTGIAIPFVGSAAGFAGAFLNPFTVGVAQGIAGVPLFSGIGFRLGLWLATTTVTVAFVMWHAHRVRENPERSPVRHLDDRKRREGLHLDTGDVVPLTSRQKGVLGVFFGGLILLVWGVMPSDAGGLGWYINEIAALFVAMGVAMAVIGGLGAGASATAFMQGVRDLAPTAVIIGLARGILIVLQDGQAIDTVLNALAGGLGGAGSAFAAQAMFLVQTAINFFVPSGSGQAALTMPVMAPLADLLGVTRQTAVLAFQMGDGFTNMIIPTSAVLMGALSLGGVPWTTWARWILPLQILLYAMGVVVLFIAVATGY